MHNVWILALMIIADVALIRSPCHHSVTLYHAQHLLFTIIYIHEHRPAMHHHMTH